jgi:hypothetical protein
VKRFGFKSLVEKTIYLEVILVILIRNWNVSPIQTGLSLCCWYDAKQFIRQYGSQEMYIPIVFFAVYIQRNTLGKSQRGEANKQGSLQVFQVLEAIKYLFCLHWMA